MENNVNKKTNNSKKILISFIIILVLALVVAIPVSILMQDKSTKKDNDKELKGPKKINQHECTKKGNVCSFNEMYEGVEVNVEVAEGKTYTFSMIANDIETMTLMLQENIEETTSWHNELINMKGPQNALQKLNEKIETWENISYIENYNYEDGGKKDLEKICASTALEDDFKCPKDSYDTRCYNGLTITNGEIKFLFNLPQDEGLGAEDRLATEGSIESKVKARLITLEEVEEFNTDKGIPTWLIENLDKNEGYWTMTSSPSMKTAYYQGAIAVVNKDGKLSIESAFVEGEEKLKIGIRPVITVYKK